MINVSNAKRLATWHAIAPTYRCFDCDNYGHIAADCPDKIPPSGIPARCRDNNTNRCDRSTSWSNNHTRHYHHNHRDKHRLSRSQSHSHNPRYRSNSRSDSHRSHSRSFHWPWCHSSSCHRQLEHIPTTAKTHHTADPHHAGISPEMTVDPEHAHPANTITKPCKRTIFQFTSNTLEIQRQEVQTSYNWWPALRVL